MNRGGFLCGVWRCLKNIKSPIVKLCFNYKLILVLNNESINLLINDWSYHLAWFCRFPSYDGYPFHLSLAFRRMYSIYYEYSCRGQICSIQIQRPAQFSRDWESMCMMLTAQISITHCIKILLPFQTECPRSYSRATRILMIVWIRHPTCHCPQVL